MDILILIVFLVLYALGIALTMVIHYYYRLFYPGRESYKREELINIISIIKEEFDLIIPLQNRQFELISLASGSVLGFILTYLGGIYGEQYESYFFHSGILPLLIYAGFGFLKKDEVLKGLPAPIKSLLNYDYSIFMGFTFSTLAKIMLVYGIYHTISFVWILINVFALFGFLVLRIVEKINKKDYKLVFRSKPSDN